MKTRVVIVELVDGESGTLSYARHHNAWEFACELMAEGAAVDLVPWGDGLDALFPRLLDADRILLWDDATLINLPATRMALGNGRIMDALDARDVVTAPCMSDRDLLSVFSGADIFARPRPDIGAGLLRALLEKQVPLPVGGFGIHWVWMHATALSRIAPPPGKAWLIGPPGAREDVTLSRRLIEGGCSVVCDPRIAVTSMLRSTASWMPASGETPAVCALAVKGAAVDPATSSPGGAGEG